MRTIQSKIVGLSQVGGIPRQGKLVGICTGCFDIFHSGHSVFFEQCKELCDILVAVVGRDSVISIQKPGRPINPEENRLYLVGSVEAVDFALLGDDTLIEGNIDCYSVARELRPDIYILNSDDANLNRKREFCDRNKMRLKIVDRIVPNKLMPTSTTRIVAALSSVPKRTPGGASFGSES